MSAQRGVGGGVVVKHFITRGAVMPDMLADGPPALAGAWAGDRRAGALTNGQLLATFPNLGALPDFTNAGGAFRPSFQTAPSIFNGRPAFLFNRANSTNLSADISDVAQGANGFWVAAIIASSGPTATTEVAIGTGTAGGAAGIGKRSANDWYHCSDTAVLSSGITYNTAPKLIVARFLGYASQLWVNGVAGNVGNAGASVLSVLKLGAGGVGTGLSNPFTGYVHYVGVFDHDPRTVDVEAAYLTALARCCGVPV